MKRRAGAGQDGAMAESQAARRALLALAASAAAAGGYGALRAGARRYQADEEQLVAAGNALPADTRHHAVRLDDGGCCHAVERGSGPPLVLVHGVTLAADVWAPQLNRLAADHRVIAVDLRGHGTSVAGDGGYSMDRLAADLVAVLSALDVRGAVLAGHSMGGMVALHAASRDHGQLHAHVGALVLVATAAGGLVSGPVPERTAALLAVAARQALGRAERRGRGLTPNRDLSTWTTRLAFGRRPAPADVELTRRLTAAMSPASLAELLATLLAFDARRDIDRIEVPTWILVGTRDRLTPPRMARAMHRAIAGSELTVLPGAGHMLMLERTEEVNEILHHASLKASAEAP